MISQEPATARQKTVPKVAMALLNWNAAELTTACIDSLLNSSIKPWLIIVVDNASRDDSADRIAEKFPDVELIRSETNLGFAGGTNVGILRGVECGADFIWVLNNDTVVDPHCLEYLVDAMEEDPRIAVTTSKIFFEVPANRIWYAGGEWNRRRLTASHLGLGEDDQGQFDKAVDVGFASGCCMLIRRSAIEAVGVFDDRFFAYAEDGDWCLRALENGLRIHYVPKSVMWHRISASVRKNAPGQGHSSPLQHYLGARNSLLLIRKHAKNPWQYLVSVSFQLYQSLYTLSGLLVLRRWDKIKSRLNGLYRGFADPI